MNIWKTDTALIKIINIFQSILPAKLHKLFKPYYPSWNKWLFIDYSLFVYVAMTINVFGQIFFNNLLNRMQSFLLCLVYYHDSLCKAWRLWEFSVPVDWSALTPLYPRYHTIFLLRSNLVPGDRTQEWSTGSLSTQPWTSVWTCLYMNWRHNYEPQKISVSAVKDTE